MKKFTLVLAFAISGCTTLSKNVELVSEGAVTSKVLIYRNSAFQAGAVSVYIGEKDKYFMKLGNDEYAVVTIDSGTHTLQAKADASPSSALNINLLPNETTCIASKPNPEMLGAAIIPLVANMVPTFVLEKVDCPSQGQLSKYELVKNS